MEDRNGCDTREAHKVMLIKVRDKGLNGREHIVGTDTHDQLLVDDDGRISYYNLQNGEGTGPHSSYEFVTEFDGERTTIPWDDDQVLVSKARYEVLESIAKAVAPYIKNSPYLIGQYERDLAEAIAKLEGLGE